MVLALGRPVFPKAVLAKTLPAYCLLMRHCYVVNRKARPLKIL